MLAAGCASVSSSANSSTAPAGSGGSAAAPATTDAAAGTPAQSATVPGGDVSSTSPAAAAPAAGPGACATRDLSAKAGSGQGTAGSVYVNLVFTNISNATCTLYGYPGVSLAGGTPVTQIGLSATESTASARQLVSLAPGAVASALLQIVDAGNFPPATCAPVTADHLQIYPPNQTTPIYLTYSAQTCSKPVQTLTIGVVQPGSGA
ncbi:MAG TPA: DUF4232 domain-containing protein [Actinocrinis sp.]|nr:DUF4232 domain-containing protein [Actinocrinis sp.]